MTLYDLITKIAQDPPSESALSTIARDLDLSLSALCDALARETGAGYLLERVSWEVGDAAMNNLFSAAYVNHNFGLPDFARRVFEAFDEGEYIHKGEPAELDGEARTRSMLTTILSQTA
jgi:hypothetical protein